MSSAVKSEMSHTGGKLVEALARLRLHEHLCLIYETREEQFAAVIPFVRLGLERGEKCIYVADENSCAAVIAAMQAEGIDTDAALTSGALSVVTKKDSYLRQGYFDPGLMIGFLAEAVKTAKKEGFTALRITGEMTWALDAGIGTDRLLEYEAELNRFFPDHDAMAICQYNRTRFSPEAIRDIILTHPLVIHGEQVCRNFYYVPPDDYLAPGHASREVDRLLRNIREREESEGELLRSIVQSSDDAIIGKDMAGNILSWNRGAERIYGYSAEEAVGRPISILIPPDMADDYREIMMRLGRGERVEHYETERLRKDGQRIEVSLTVSPLRDAGEAIVGASVIARDITEYRWTERVNSARLRLLQFAATHTLDELLEATLNEAEALTGSLIGFYHFLEADQKTLSLQNWSTRTKAQFCTAAGKGRHYDVTEAGVWVDCIHERRPVIHNDYASLPHRKGLPPGHAPVVRELVVPVFRGENIVAILGVGNKPRDYVARDVEVVSLLADLAWETAERKRREQELRHSEERFSAAFHSSPDLIAITRIADGTILEVNEAFSRLLGYTRAETIGKTTTDLAIWIDPADRETFIASLEKSGRIDEFETILRRRDGTLITCLDSARTIDFGGERCVLSVVRDISERKRAEEVMAQSEARLREAQRIARLGNWELDLVSNVLVWSDEIYRIFEMDREKFGASYDAFLAAIHPDDRDFVDRAYTESVANHAPYDIVHRLLMKDGRLKYVNERCETFYGEDGRPERSVGTVHDITERMTAEVELRTLYNDLEQRVNERTAALKQKSEELAQNQRALMNIVEDLNEKTEELEQANTKLKELDRLKSMFIASMSHELRTPLNSIIGFSSILHDEWVGPVNAEQKENLAIILCSGEHLLNLINDVIDVSKIEAGKIESVVEEFDLRDLVREAVSLVAKELEEKGLALRVDAVHQQMHTDRRRLLQCVLNLLSNAVKFTEQGSVTLETRTVQGVTPDMAEIAVTDTGVGIRDEDLPRMFQPFVRLVSPQQASIPGTGLGLYLSRKLAGEVLKGDILLTSEYGRGSRFTIRLPVRLP